jgi:acyl-ACP thioesterase
MFTNVFGVPYYGLDMRDRLKTGLLLQFFQETAALHAEAVGVGVSQLQKRDFTWVLRRYRINIHSLPGLGDLTVRTWYEPQRNLISVRLFEIQDSSGALVADAWSGWVVLDLKRGRPTRLDHALPKEYYDNAGHVSPGDIEDVGKSGGFDTETDFHVRWHELDLNGHTNHTVHFDWVMESVPEDILMNYAPAVFDAEYLVSIPRTNVTVRTKKLCCSPAKFAHSVLLTATGTEAARLTTTWSKI